MTHLKVFGSIAYIHIPKTDTKKLDTKTRKCIFVGYKTDSKVYRLFNPIQRKIELTRDVTMDETRIGFRYLSEITHEPVTYLPSYSPDISDPDTAQTQPLDPDYFPADNLAPMDQNCSPPTGSNQTPNSPPSSKSPPQPQSDRRNPSRCRHPPSRFRDYWMMPTEIMAEPLTYNEASSKQEWRQAMQ